MSPDEMLRNGIDYGLIDMTNKQSEKIDKELALRIVKLLSALETLGMIKSSGQAFHDYLFDEITMIVDTLSAEILK